MIIVKFSRQKRYQNVLNTKEGLRKLDIKKHIFLSKVCAHILVCYSQKLNVPVHFMCQEVLLKLESVNIVYRGQ